MGERLLGIGVCFVAWRGVAWRGAARRGVGLGRGVYSLRGQEASEAGNTRDEHIVVEK